MSFCDHPKEYTAWRNMLKRCRIPTHPDYDRYGGRGISVCDRWRSLPAFLADVGPAPGAEYTLDRINNDGLYEPGNVRWATRRQQARNRSTTRFITAGGITRSLSEWVAVLGINESALRRLIQRWGETAALHKGLEIEQESFSCAS